MEAKTVNVNGRPVSYATVQDSGSGLLVLLAPAAADAPREYARASGLPFRIAYVPLDGEITRERADEVIAVADAEDAEDFRLIGVSGGACLAIHVAARHANRVRSLVVIEPTVDANGLPSAESEWISATTLWEAAGMVRCPMLMIRGAESEAFAQAALNRLRTVAASSFTRVLPNVGHDVFEQRTDDIRDAVAQFLVGRRR